MLAKLKLAAALCFVLGLTLAAIGQTPPLSPPAPLRYPVGIEVPPEETVPGLDGILKAVDTGKNTLRIMVTGEKDEKDFIFSLTKTIAVTVNGARLGFQKKEGKLADLKAGMRVRLTLSDDKKNVVGIDEQRSQQGAQRRNCPKCGTCCGLELSREWCESFPLYKTQLTCWCEIAQFVIGTQGGRSAESQKIKERDWAETMDKAFAEAKKTGKLLLHFGNTGG